MMIHSVVLDSAERGRELLKLRETPQVVVERGSIAAEVRDLDRRDQPGECFARIGEQRYAREDLAARHRRRHAHGRAAHELLQRAQEQRVDRFGVFAARRELLGIAERTLDHREIDGALAGFVVGRRELLVVAAVAHQLARQPEHEQRDADDHHAPQKECKQRRQRAGIPFAALVARVAMAIVVVVADPAVATIAPRLCTIRAAGLAGATAAVAAAAEPATAAHAVREAPVAAAARAIATGEAADVVLGAGKILLILVVEDLLALFFDLVGNVIRRHRIDRSRSYSEQPHQGPRRKSPRHAGLTSHENGHD